MPSIRHDARSRYAEIAFVSDPGRDPDKQVNEDACVHLDTSLGALVVVCDGMGGHAGGREASQLAIATITSIVHSAPTSTSPGAALKRALEEANARIWQMPTAEAGYRPGSTAVAALIHGSGIDVAHVGDSRLYLIHEGAIAQITIDHSVVQEMVSRNLIRAEDASSHPLANKILRALGIAKDVEVELRAGALPYVAGDVLVLCSDGLSDLVEPQEILRICEASPADAAAQLVDLANARGGHDNVTALVVRLTENSDLSASPTLLKTIALEPVSAPAPLTARSTQHAMFAPLPAPSTPAISATMTQGPSSLPSPHAQVAEARRQTPLRVAWVGVGLAILAVALLAAVLATLSRPKHRAVPLVDDEKTTPSTTADDDDTSAAASIVPAPPLSVPAIGEGLMDAGHRVRRKDAH